MLIGPSGLGSMSQRTSRAIAGRGRKGIPCRGGHCWIGACRNNDVILWGRISDSLVFDRNVRDYVKTSNSEFCVTVESVKLQVLHGLGQVSTLDGRIKLFGRFGVERLLFCRDKQPTQQLLFLVNWGALIRLSKVNGSNCSAAQIFNENGTFSWLQHLFNKP